MATMVWEMRMRKSLGEYSRLDGILGYDLALVSFNFFGQSLLFII